MKLTKTQIDFLEIAADGEWFNRRDVFISNLNYMPYTVGLSLFNKGLLETNPPGHPKGYDLNFRITRKGKIALTEA